MIEPNGIYNTEELATILGYKTRTLEDWRRDARGPAYAALPKGVRYRGQDVLDWLAERTVRA